MILRHSRAATAQMVVAKKSKEKKPKKERKDDDDDDWDDDEPDKEEEEEVEGKFAKRKREKGRKAFAGLARSLMSLIPFAMILSQQPFMEKPRQPGVNRVKLIPLQLAIAGAVQWTKESPTALRNPQLGVYLNYTAEVLLTPNMYFKTRSRKTATDREKTVAKAYEKAKKELGRVAAGDTTLQNIIAMPMPNIPLIGAYVLVVGSLLAPLLAGLEYAVVGGGLLVLQGCRVFGMEPQPEMYVTGVVAVLAILAMDMSNKKLPDEPKKKKSK